MSELKNFVFFGSIRESVEALDEEQGNKLLRAVMIYGTESVIIEDDPAILAVLHSIIPNIDRCHQRYSNRLEFQKAKNLKESTETNKQQKNGSDPYNNRSNGHPYGTPIR